ncbi:MAG TPA: hypothetical protein PLZ05_03590 [Alphaproteobacteria bacterium]|nr:hypothetical protein [Alphaproteobacteria bacterium]
MKRLNFLIFGICLMGSTADAAQNYLIGDDRRVYEQKTGWYATLRAEMNLLSWTNSYYSDWVGYGGSDDYSYEPVLGGSLTVGKTFSYFWRGEVEAGYTGNFMDKDSGVEFNFSTPYLLFNALHDFNNDFYLGASLGVAFPTTSWDWDAFISGPRQKTSISPMGGLILGFSHRLDYRFILDLRYRLAGFYGTKHTRDFEAGTPPDYLDLKQYYFQSDIGLVLDNQFSVGLRYEF